MKLENIEDLLQDIFEVSEQGLEIEKFVPSYLMN